MDLFDVAIAAQSTQVIEYKPMWRNNQGSFMPLATFNFIHWPVGSVLCTLTPEAERVLVVVTPFGNVVLHEADRNARFIVVHAPTDLQGLWGRGKLTDDQVEAVLGLWGKDNIGLVLDRLVNSNVRRVA